jgi:hypothetical protein
MNEFVLWQGDVDRLDDSITQKTTTLSSEEIVVGSPPRAPGRGGHVDAPPPASHGGRACIIKVTILGMPPHSDADSWRDAAIVCAYQPADALAVRLCDA